MSAVDVDFIPATHPPTLRLRRDGQLYRAGGRPIGDEGFIQRGVLASNPANVRSQHGVDATDAKTKRRKVMDSIFQCSSTRCFKESLAHRR